MTQIKKIMRGERGATKIEEIIFHQLNGADCGHFFFSLKISKKHSPQKMIIYDRLSIQGFFLVSSGAEIRPLSQWDLGDFFPNLKKKIPISKYIFFFF